jgi:hypothetical protein
MVLDKALPEALQHLLAERHISQVIIDGNKPKLYIHQLKKGCHAESCGATRST